MAFCTYCGTQLGNGMVCNCQGVQPVHRSAAPPPSRTAAQTTAYSQTPPQSQYQQQYQQPNMAGTYGGVSPKKKIVMILLTIFGFHIGLQYFYAGLTKKGLLFLFLYWPCFVIGWITLVLLIGWGFFAGQVILVAIAVNDLIKLVKGQLLDGNGLPIVS